MSNLDTAIAIKSGHLPRPIPPLVPIGEMKNLFDQVFSRIRQECGGLPYHNLDHTYAVGRRFEEFGRQAGLGPTEMNLGRTAIVFHDLGHSGQAVRQQVAGLARFPKYSNEEYAAALAEEYLTGRVSNDAIIFIQCLILATTFNQSQGAYKRPYKPETKLEKVIVLSDIGGFTDGWEDWIQESLRIYRENCNGRLVIDVGAWLKDRRRFLNHLSSTVGAAKQYFDEDYARELISKLELLSAENSNRVSDIRQMAIYDGLQPK